LIIFLFLSYLLRSDIMVDKLPNSKNDSYNKREPKYDNKKQTNTSIDSVRQNVKDKVSKIIGK